MAQSQGNVDTFKQKLNISRKESLEQSANAASKSNYVPDDDLSLASKFKVI